MRKPGPTQRRSGANQAESIAPGIPPLLAPKQTTSRSRGETTGEEGCNRGHATCRSSRAVSQTARLQGSRSDKGSNSADSEPSGRTELVNKSESLLLTAHAASPATQWKYYFRRLPRRFPCATFVARASSLGSQNWRNPRSHASSSASGLASSEYKRRAPSSRTAANPLLRSTLRCCDTAD